MAGEVALEQPGGLAAAFAFGDPSSDVVLGFCVVLAPVEDDRVQRSVELPVTAAAESVPSGPAAGGGHRRDAGKPREGGLGAQPAAVRPGDDQLRGDDRVDTRLLEQRGREERQSGARVHKPPTTALSAFDCRNWVLTPFTTDMLA